MKPIWSKAGDRSALISWRVWCLDVHYGGGEFLGQPVVDLVGHQLPVPVVLFEQSPQLFLLPSHGGFGPLALVHLALQLSVGLGQFGRPLRHPPFEILLGFEQFPFGLLLSA